MGDFMGDDDSPMGSPRAGSPVGSPSQGSARSFGQKSPLLWASPSAGGTVNRGNEQGNGRVATARFRGDIGASKSTVFNSSAGLGGGAKRNLDFEMRSPTGSPTGSQPTGTGANFDADVAAMAEKFQQFLNEFEPTGTKKNKRAHYMHQLANMWSDVPEDKVGEGLAFPIDCQHLNAFDKQLYTALVGQPLSLIPVLDMVLWQQSLAIVTEMYPKVDEENVGSIRAKTFNLLEEDQRLMRFVDPCDIERLLSLKGIVIRCSDIIPDMNQAVFVCTTPQCEETVVAEIHNYRAIEPRVCAQCAVKNSYRLSHNMSRFGDKQMVKLQETPEHIPAGETPESIMIYCFDELYDTMKPGDRVTVTGTLRAAPQRINPRMAKTRAVYRTYVDCISVVKESSSKEEDDHENMKDLDTYRPLEDEYDLNPNQVGEEEAATNKKIRELAAEVDEQGRKTILKKLLQSVAPSIHENEHVKRGLLCQLFGGTRKSGQQASKGRFRSEIHVLLCGDPSTAKSQMMTYVNKLSSRGVITSGKGSSAVGLTAYISKDADTGEYLLESGALVLSDRGICGIDEFDKMDEATRAVLNEAMEQQTVSVAKVGIVCSLNARVSILATANPINSRYDVNKTIMENINLPATLTSRFDLLYLMLDKQDRASDTMLARHIASMHSQRGIQSQQEPPLDRNLLRAYVDFARRRCRPVLSEEASDLLVNTYLKMRSGDGGGSSVTPRTLESLLRLAEAFAKMELRSSVTKDDIIKADNLYKAATFAAAVDPVTGKIDFQSLRTGVSVREREVMEEAAGVVKELLSHGPLSVGEARTKTNEVLSGRQKGPLKWALFKEVVDDLVRAATCIQDGDALSLP